MADDPPTGWRKYWASVRSNSLVASAGVIVTILTPFLLVSESFIKKYLDGWTSDCLIVFDVEEAANRPNRLMVTAYAQGKTPASIPITFSATDAQINSILFMNPLAITQSAYANHAVHPHVNQTCPGQLCESQGNLPSSVLVTVPLSDFNAAFAYVFYVDFQESVRAPSLRVFVQYEEGLKDSIVCRAEGANAFNLFTRLSKLGQFFAVIFVFVAITILVAAVRNLSTGGPK
jgi:hypothetical protein